jgi:hypothetical protein
LRLSLRMLIVLVMVSGSGLGWFVSARRQRAAVAALEGAGCSVRYDWQPEIEGWRGRDEPAWKQWLRNDLGSDCFGSIVAVDFCANGSDREMLLLSRCRRLENLSLAYSPVSDAGVAMLRGLGNLKQLDLRNVKVCDAELARLVKSNPLKSLDIARTDITDAGLAQLSGETSLEVLCLDHTKITDAGLSHLRRLSKLSYLSLADTSITDAGLIHLKALSNLDTLNVAGTPVSDGGVRDFLRARPRTRIHRRSDLPCGQLAIHVSRLVERAKRLLDSEARRQDHRVFDGRLSPPLARNNDGYESRGGRVPPQSSTHQALH